MKNTGSITKAIALVITVLFIIGCTTQTTMKFVPQQGELTTYKSITELQKDYRFDQPSKNKLTEQSSYSRIEMTFDQRITDIDKDRNATAEITIKSLSQFTKTPEGIKVDFDSTRDTTSPLTKLIGKSYKIKISPTGEVTQVIDARDIRTAVKDREWTKIIANLFNNEAIKNRHSITALPQKLTRLSVGDSWTRTASSPPFALIPKTYEKRYTVKEISQSPSGTIATIEMQATPTVSPETAESPENQMASLLSGMFDSNDVFIGQLIINTDTGRIIKYYESLTCRNTAVDVPRNTKTDKVPDTLQLGFKFYHSLEAIDENL